MKIRTARGLLALAWAATAGLSRLPAAAQTPKSARHDEASGAPASLLATLQKDLKAELEGQEDECLPLKDHVDISRFDLGQTRETRTTARTVDGSNSPIRRAHSRTRVSA